MGLPICFSFIYGLFNDAVYNFYSIESNNRMISEKWIGKNVEAIVSSFHTTPELVRRA